MLEYLRQNLDIYITYFIFYLGFTALCTMFDIDIDVASVVYFSQR